MIDEAHLSPVHHTRSSQARLVSIEREAEMKAQRDADEIEFMLSQVSATIARPSPKSGNTRMHSLQTIPSGNNSPGRSADHSGNHSPRERADYGLSKETLSMLVTGATFNVPNFLKLKTPKFFYVTTDIANIAHRTTKGNHQTVMAFDKFEL